MGSITLIDPLVRRLSLNISDTTLKIFLIVLRKVGGGWNITEVQKHKGPIDRKTSGDTKSLLSVFVISQKLALKSFCIVYMMVEDGKRLQHSIALIWELPLNLEYKPPKCKRPIDD